MRLVAASNHIAILTTPLYARPLLTVCHIVCPGMSRYGVTPNMLVMPPQMLLYMALAPEQKLTYKEGGPAAEARFEAGVAGFEARAFRGCGVVTSEPFEVSDGALERSHPPPPRPSPTPIA